MTMTNEEILDEIAMVRNHGKASRHIYRRAVNHYCNFNQMTMQELLDEADQEEEQGIRWKRRKLKQRLLRYRQYLIQQYKKSTVKSYFTSVLVIYKYYDIEIGNLPPLNDKNLQLPTPISFKDLLTHEEIDYVLKNTNAKFNAVILFMTSSGCARAETLSLTIQDFIDATRDYHHANDIATVLTKLKHMDNVIPTFYLKRIKTNKYYYTFCSPEAVKSIVNYLITDRLYNNNQEIILKPQDKLFQFGKNYLPYALNQLNNELGLGSAGTYNRLRTHMFRKFHASTLKKAGMSESDIDALQGRGKSSTRASYFYEDPQVLREKYIECLPDLVINDNVNVLDFKAPEYQRLEEAVREKEKQLKEMEDIKHRIEALETNRPTWNEVIGGGKNDCETI